jgi:bifunctional enzyme CysN/CysC
MRFPVQLVIRGSEDFRGYGGRVASGSMSRGDAVTVARSGAVSRIERLVTFDGDVEEASAGQAITVMLSDHVDVSRGDLLSHADDPPQVADQLAAYLVWFEEQPMLPGRSYLMRIGTQTTTATITGLKHKVDIVSGGKIAARTLSSNEIGFCNLSTGEPIALDAYGDNRETGAFVLIDRQSAATMGAGMVAFALHRATNIKHQSYTVDKTARAVIKAQQPCIVWFTGLPAAGKSTIMNLVEQRLHRAGVHTYVLDGDNLRHGLNRDLGFTDADRVENVRRAGEVARLMVDAGLIVLCAFISPFQAERQMARELVRSEEFIEVFVDTPLEVCKARDPKGLYAKADAGLVSNVTGIDSPYEPPQAPEIHLLTVLDSAATLADRTVDYLVAHAMIPRG